MLVLTDDNGVEIKDIKVMMSQRNCSLLVINGYKFSFHKLLEGNVHRWRCARNTCTASLKLNNDGNIIERRLVHNHEEEKKLKRDKFNDCFELGPTECEPEPLPVMHSSQTQVVSPRSDLKTLVKPDLSNIRRKVFLALQNPLRSAEKDYMISDTKEPMVAMPSNVPAGKDPLAIDIKVETLKSNVKTNSPNSNVKIEKMETQVDDYHDDVELIPTVKDNVVNIISDSDGEAPADPNPVICEPSNTQQQPSLNNLAHPSPKSTSTQRRSTTPSTSSSAPLTNSFRHRPLRTKREQCNDDFGKFVASYLTKIPEDLEDGVKLKIHQILYTAGKSDK